jgi:putative tryptophan/tyrosine transport system substrate-binding protein
MPTVIRRLGLGLVLIGLASAILLYADRGRRVAATVSSPAAAPQRTVRIAILQHADSAVMEDGVKGMLEGLASRGYKAGENGVTIDRFNAQGDIPTDATIARQITAGDYDLVLTSSTPSMQAVANANKEGKVKHVFGLVADPFASGVGLDRSHPLQHLPYMVGQGSFPPVETAFEIARKMFPKLERIGVAWNPAEANSLAFVEKGRAAAKKMGITLLEANADSSSAVADAVSSLIGRNAQAIWVGGDNTVATAIDTVIAIGRRMHVPVFSVLPGAPDRGTLFDAGFDFVEVGRQAGLLAADVLDGKDPATIPIRDVGDIIPPYLSINTTVLEGLRDPWRAPAGVLKAANVVVDKTGIHRQPGGAPAGGGGR